MWVVLLALAGILALWAVIWTVNAPPAAAIKPNFYCDSLSPDGKYRCMDVMAHNGWCHNRDIEWRYESWAVGSDDDTRLDQEPEQRDTPTQVTTAVRKRLSKLVIAAGVLLVMSVYSFAYDSTHPKQATPKYDCNWQAVRCDWTPR